MRGVRAGARLCNHDPADRGPRAALLVAVAAIIVMGCATTRTTPATGFVTSSPAESDACLIADSSAPPADTVYAVVPTTDRSASGAAPVDCSGRAIPVAMPPVVVFDNSPAGTDLRDVLDRGPGAYPGHRPDIVVTRDPDVLAYAASRDDYRAVALPWDRTYVLLVADADSVATLPSPGERDALARDAVRSDARGAEPPFPWLDNTACPPSAVATAKSTQPALAYDAGDPIARQLAERTLALAGSDVRADWIPTALRRTYAPGLRIAAVPRDSLTDEFATGRIAGAVTAYSRNEWMACGTRAATYHGYRGIPLIDSRAHVLVRRGSGVRFYIVRDGTLWFTRQRLP